MVPIQPDWSSRIEYVPESTAPKIAQPFVSVDFVVTPTGPVASTPRFLTPVPATFLTITVSVPEPGCGATMLVSVTGLMPRAFEVTVDVMRRKLPSPPVSAQLMFWPWASVTHCGVGRDRVLEPVDDDLARRRDHDFRVLSSAVRRARSCSWSFSASAAATVRALLAPAVEVTESIAASTPSDDDDEHRGGDDDFHQRETVFGCRPSAGARGSPC